MLVSLQDAGNIRKQFHWVYKKSITNADSSSPHGAGSSSTAVRISARDIPKTLLAIQKSRLLSHKLLIPTESKDGNEEKFGHKVVKGLLGNTTFDYSFLVSLPLEMYFKSRWISLVLVCPTLLLLCIFSLDRNMSCKRLLLMDACWPSGPLAHVDCLIESKII